MSADRRARLSPPDPSPVSVLEQWIEDGRQHSFSSVSVERIPSPVLFRISRRSSAFAYVPVPGGQHPLTCFRQTSSSARRLWSLRLAPHPPRRLARVIFPDLVYCALAQVTELHACHIWSHPSHRSANPNRMVAERKMEAKEETQSDGEDCFLGREQCSTGADVKHPSLPGTGIPDHIFRLEVTGDTR